VLHEKSDGISISPPQTWNLPGVTDRRSAVTGTEKQRCASSSHQGVQRAAVTGLVVLAQHGHPLTRAGGMIAAAVLIFLLIMIALSAVVGLLWW
jgi:hypothetical protein